MRLRKLHEIMFPVYKLRTFDDLYTNKLGILKIDTPRKSWDLDDTNLSIPYPMRRIKMKSAGREVYPLSDKMDTFSEIVHCSSGSTFIDSEGGLFEYSKSGKYWGLKYYKIDRMELIGDRGHTVVVVRGLPVPFLFGTVLNSSIKYIGLLVKHGMYVPYDLSFFKKEDTRRMI